MKLLIKNIGLLATPTGSYAKRGAEMSEISKMRDVSVVAENGEIVGIYPKGTEPSSDYDKVIDAENRLVTPGFVDSHTHLVFGGWRQHEVPLKIRGASYLEILENGGGILDTVRNTRNESFEELYQKGMTFIKKMAAIGVTSLEIKSGYGLDMENELKQLRVIKKLREDSGLDIMATFMPAHATPPEFYGNTEKYTDHICEYMLPELDRLQKGGEKLAHFCDVFCESGVFNTEQSERILTEAKKIGLIPKVHADEINVIGAVPMGVKMEAISADHLIAIDDEGIKTISESGTIATVLPSTSFYLGENFAPAKKLIKSGAAVAIASDFNPGSCPSFNMQLCVNLAYLKYRMTAEEILTAVTINGAAAIDMADKVGTIERGKQADLVIWDAEDLETLLYRLGDNLVKTVIKKGEIIC